MPENIKSLAILSLVRIADSFGALLISFVIAAMPLDNHQAGVLASIALAGMFFGAPIMGRLADALGRRIAIALSLSIYSIFTLLAFRFNSYIELLVLRFLAGFGIGGVLPTASTAFIELAPVERRGFYVSVFESMRAIGSLIVALTARYTLESLGRRYLFLIGAFPIVLVPLVLSLEESRYYKARKRVKLEGIYRITLLVAIIRFSLAFSYYGRTLRTPRYLRTIGFSLKASSDFLIYASLAMIAGYYLNALIVDSLGRRKLLALYSAIAGIALILFDLTLGNLLVDALIFAAFNAAARCVAYTYTPELYPTYIRGTAMGVAGAIARIGGLSGPIVLGRYNSFIPLAISLFIASLAAREIGIETAGKELKRGFFE